MLSLVHCHTQGHKVFMPGEFGVKIGDLQDKFTLKV